MKTCKSPTTLARKLAAVVTSVVLAVALASASSVMGAAPASAGANDYPWAGAAFPTTQSDPWGEYLRQCTSFVSWRLHSRNGFDMPFHDNAGKWGADAAARGYRVDSTPAVGAVAEQSGPTYYHVAWVEAVNRDGTVTTEEYNWRSDGAYHERTTPASAWSHFIHFKDLAATATGRDRSDFNGDGTADVIARRSDGLLFLYPGNGSGGWKSGGVQIGSGWNQFSAIVAPGDFNGDGTADVIARRSDGLLFLYPGNGSGGWKSGGVQIGSGWNQFSAIVPGSSI